MDSPLDGLRVLDLGVGAVVPEAAVCERHGIEMVFDLGGTDKADSSTRINQTLGREG